MHLISQQRYKRAAIIVFCSISVAFAVGLFIERLGGFIAKGSRLFLQAIPLVPGDVLKIEKCIDVSINISPRLLKITQIEGTCYTAHAVLSCLYTFAHVFPFTVCIPTRPCGVLQGSCRVSRVFKLLFSLPAAPSLG